MRRLRAWLRWELGRPIEVTPMIRFITIERFAKAVVLIGGGAALLVATARGDALHRWAESLQSELNLAPGRGVFHRLYDRVVVELASLSRLREAAVGTAALLYGALEGFEGVGLLLRRRWAEYLVLLATGAFVPLEVDELVRHPTFVKVGALALNLAIMVYLVWRKRLFLERPGVPPVADPTRPMP